MMFLLCSFKYWLCAGGFMQDAGVTSAEAVQIIFHKDDKTPREFVMSLLRGVFGMSEREAYAQLAKIGQQGKSACGPFPAAVAKALIQETELRIREAGHALRITCEDDTDASDETENVRFAYACEAL